MGKMYEWIKKRKYGWKDEGNETDNSPMNFREHF
jgi:hypothetical protein